MKAPSKEFEFSTVKIQIGKGYPGATSERMGYYANMGERAAVWILKAAYPLDSMTDMMVQNTGFIVRPSSSERRPAVTVCLLEVLIARPIEAETRQKLQTTLEYVFARRAANQDRDCSEEEWNAYATRHQQEKGWLPVRVPPDEHQPEYDSIRQDLLDPKFKLNADALARYRSMGDRVAIGILKAFFPLEPLSEDQLHRVLGMLRGTFEHPKAILEEFERTPAVSVCLLENLLAKTQFPDHKASIQSTLDYILVRCASPPT